MVDEFPTDAVGVEVGDDGGGAGGADLASHTARQAGGKGNDLLSPTLSSNGGEGEDRACRRLWA